MILPICIFSLFFVCRETFAAAIASSVSIVDVLPSILAPIVMVFVSFFGQLLITSFKLLVYVSKFNDFINFPYVTVGWTMLRDVVNMLFIVGLLFIAFVTVLNVQKYEWTKLLFRLLVMAILVNFSRTILGLLIDAFQIIMLTFVNAYKDIAEGNLFAILGIPNLGTFIQNPDKITDTQTLVSMLMSLIFIVVSLIVVFIYCIILAFRIVVLWILIIVSPLAFFSWVFEGAVSQLGSFSGQFWRYLWQYLSVGPMLAFFLWLSLSTLTNMNLPVETGSTTQVGLGLAGTFDNIAKYLFAILTLVAALVLTSSFQVAGASYAGRAVNWMKDQSVGRLERGARRAAAGAGYMATTPVRALKPYATGVAEGVSQKLQAGRFTKLLTSAGRKRTSEAMRADAESLVLSGRAGTAEQRKIQAENAESYKKNRPDINWENPNEVREKILDKEMKKTPAILRDKAALEAAYTALADKGQLQYNDLKEMQGSGGLLDGKGRRNKQIFLEDMEKRVEKETGRHKSFSDLIYNEDTNEYEVVSDLIEKAKIATADTKDEDLLNRIADLDPSKITKKDTEGIYKLDKDSDEYKRLESSDNKKDVDFLNYLKGKEDKGVQKDSEFWTIMRSSQAKSSRRKEVQKGIGTANQERLNKSAKQTDLLDIMKNPVDYVMAEGRGLLQQIPRIGGLDQPGRDNIKTKLQFMFGSGEERAKLIDKNKNLFDPSLHNKSADELAKMAQIKELDRQVSNLSLDDLEKYQDLAVEVSSKFNTIGQKLDGGEGQKDDHIEDRIKTKRKKETFTVGVEQELGKVLVGSGFADERNKAIKFIDVQAADMLKATEGMGKDERVIEIADRMAGEPDSGLFGRGEIAQEMTKYLLQKESEIKARDKIVKDKQKELAQKIKQGLRNVTNQFNSGQKNPKALQFYFKALSKNLSSDIEKNALNKELFSYDALQKQFDDAINLIEEKDKAEFNKKMKDIRDTFDGLGLKVKEK